MKKTAKEAKAANETRYFTGKPCKNGHISERFTANRECVACHDIRKGYVKPEPTIEPVAELKPTKTYRVVEFKKPTNPFHRKAVITREYFITR